MTTRIPHTRLLDPFIEDSELRAISECIDTVAKTPQSCYTIQLWGMCLTIENLTDYIVQDYGRLTCSIGDTSGG
jgi:hypothetical protein